LRVSKRENDPNQNQIVFFHQGTRQAYTQIITTKELLPIYLVILFYFVLLCFSALFSGLNLGLMSLDLTELNLLKKIGTKSEKKHAAKIYPLRKKGNLLLCTILLGNVLVNSTSTLILGNYVEGIFAAMGSTFLIVIFGEIIPQAICSRHGLAVGAHTRYITYFMMGLTSIASYPMSKCLDFFLGKEIAMTYSRDKVRELMRQAKDEKGIEEKQFKLISGALDFKHKRVKDIMVPIKEVFSLDINSILDFDTFKLILYHGYSRIPVFEYTKENLVGLILIQDLLLNDPADKVPLRAVMDYYKHRVPKCKLENSLESMFDMFRKGDSHMAFVYNNDDNLSFYNNETNEFLDTPTSPTTYNNKDKSNDHLLTNNNNNNNSLNSGMDNLHEKHTSSIKEAVGICTLENIIEELVQSEIMDEADTKRERRRKRN
jgi:metal transporter CNNM